MTRSHITTHLIGVIDLITVKVNIVQVIRHITMTRVMVSIMVQTPITVGQTLRHMDTTRVNMDMLRHVGPTNDSICLLAVIIIHNMVVVAMHMVVLLIIIIIRNNRVEGGLHMGIREAGEVRSALNMAVATSFQHWVEMVAVGHISIIVARHYGNV